MRFMFTFSIIEKDIGLFFLGLGLWVRVKYSTGRKSGKSVSEKNKIKDGLA